MAKKNAFIRCYFNCFFLSFKVIFHLDIPQQSISFFAHVSGDRSFRRIWSRFMAEKPGECAWGIHMFFFLLNIQRTYVRFTFVMKINVKINKYYVKSSPTHFLIHKVYTIVYEHRVLSRRLRWTPKSFTHILYDSLDAHCFYGRF